MHAPAADAIHAAARRLRGHLVLPPLIGGLLLPNPGGADVRLWPDQLQPGGSASFRGSLHFLLRQLGSGKDLLVVGTPRRALSAAVAAHGHRLPVHAILTCGPTREVAALLTQLGCTFAVESGSAAEAAAEAWRRQRGGLRLPDSSHADAAAGLATAGLDLAAALPRDCAAVYAPSTNATSLAAGLRAGGSAAEVVAVEPTAAEHAELAAVLFAAHRLACEPEGLSVLAAALRHPAGAMVAAFVAE